MAAVSSEANIPTASEATQPAARSTPKDALVMAAILKEMGISDYEPRVVNQMLEFTYRYISTVLDDAKVYSSHASKKEIDADDVRLAIQSRLDHSYTNPPPRDFLIEIARQKNRTPLPQIQPKSGLRLPPDRYCLTGTNYKLKAQKKPTVRASPVVSRTPSVSSSSGIPIGTSMKPAQVMIRTPSMSATMVTTIPRTVGVPPQSPVIVTPVTMTTGLVSKVVKQEPGPSSTAPSTVTLTPVQIATRPAATTATLPNVSQVASKNVSTPGAASAARPTATKAAVGKSASMMTISALPSMDETVASAHQPLITPLKRKHEDDDYDS